MEINVKNLRFVNDNGVHKLYAKDINKNTAKYFQVDKEGKVVYSFLGNRNGEYKNNEE